MEVVTRIDLMDADESDNTASEEFTVYPKSTTATDAQLVKPQQISENIYQLGNVVFDTRKREVSVPGEINIVGANVNIEFFACGKLGKTHESILILDAEPFHMFAALGALDFEAGMNLTVEGDPRPPTGSPVEIWVEWNRGDEVISHRAVDGCATTNSPPNSFITLLLSTAIQIHFLIIRYRRGPMTGRIASIPMLFRLKGQR